VYLLKTRYQNPPCGRVAAIANFTDSTLADWNLSRREDKPL
jgi:hypothetical protein